MQECKEHVIKVIGCWEERMLIAVNAHYEAARGLSRHQRLVGGLLAFLGVFVTVVGATAELSRFGNGLLVTLSGALLTGASVVQTFLNWSERAERHRISAVRLSSVRREIEYLRAFLDTLSDLEVRQTMDKIRTKSLDISQDAPGIPGRYWHNAFVQVTKDKCIARSVSGSH